MPNSFIKTKEKCNKRRFIAKYAGLCIKKRCEFSKLFYLATSVAKVVKTYIYYNKRRFK